MNYVRKSGFKPSTTDNKRSIRASATPSSSYKYNLPASVDWRTKGVLNPVKDQGGCGSCWAFGTIAALESALAIATGNLQSLSEQNLVDCTYGRDGCSGGNIAFNLVQQQGGIASQTSYPYSSGSTGKVKNYFK